MRAADVYRALLWCYPAEFREEYGTEMVGAFAEQLREAHRSAGRVAAARIWVGTFVDIIPTAFREHGHVMQQDLRHAIRILTASPGFTAVAVLSLALGIGANTAIFSLVNSVLMSTLPVRNPHELVMLTDPLASGLSVGMESGERSLITYAEFVDLQAQNSTFASLMASQSSLQRIDARVTGQAREELRTRMVSASFFETLGVRPVLGRTFEAAREPAPGTVPYAVISYDFWQRRFGGRDDALGRSIALGNGVLSVIGVMPAAFFGETVGERPDVWIPLAMQATVLPGRDWLHDQPGNVEKVMWLHLFGRLRPEVSLERAQANANVIFQRGLAAYYGTMADAETRKRFLDQRLQLKPAATGASSLRGDFAEPLFVLLGAAALVLLIACSNLGNLLLSRTTARTREMAVRLALGASRARLIRQLLTESLCLAVVGGLVGLGVAALLRNGLLRLVSNEAIALPSALDLRVLGFVFALTIVGGLMLGLLPASRITKTPAAKGLREEGRTIAGSAAWLRVGKAVVIGQLALSLPLLIGAGLLVRTLVNLQRIDVGYSKDDLIMVRVDGQSAGYDPDRQAAAFDALLRRIRAMPGVRVATYSNNGLFQGSDNGDRIIVEGYTPKGDNDRGSRYDQVGPRYFSTLGVPVLLGREITEDDRAGGRTVCVINETFAKRFFAGRNPLGLHVTQEYADQRHAYEIIGVVRDSRQNRLRAEIEHRLYVPAAQPAASISAATFIIRPRGDGSSVLADVRRAIQQAEPKMPIGRAATVSDAIDERIVQDRLLARLSIAFGVVAVLLAAMGLYGVLSYGVARRTNEIGIRKALGARQGTLIAMIVRETGWLLAVGVIAGAALSVAAIRLITSRLYGLSPSDPVTLVVATVALAIVALIATLMPAYRAARVDPLVALRYE
jgi:putative ABC transport system permease protein